MSADIKVLIQQEDFSLEEETNNIGASDEDGALVTFIGKVRGNTSKGLLKSMYLEHYPGMTEKSIIAIAERALEKWSLGKITVIHRVGKLVANDRIVFVGVTSPHRESAFLACEFIMDFLKVEAPFWKKEQFQDSEYWVEAKKTDKEKATSWDISS